MASLNITNQPPTKQTDTNINLTTLTDPANTNAEQMNRRVSFPSDQNLLATDITHREHTNNARNRAEQRGLTTPPRLHATGPVPLTPDMEQVNQDDIMPPALPSDGPLTKACMELSMGTNLTTAAEKTTALYRELLAEGAGPTSAELVLTFGDQPAPFPLLAMNSNNNIVILHGTKRLVIPYGHTHPSKGKTIAFLGDPTPGYGVPPIVQLDTKDFDDAKPWFHPELASLSEAHARQGQVLPVPETAAMVHSPKIIPIPLFLVPFFLQGGKPKSAIDTLNNYQQKFLVNATLELAENTRHILHFLLAATGYDASQDTNTKPPTSQLAVEMEPLKFDLVLTHWATNQFAGLWQIARVYNTKHSNRTLTDQTQNNTNSRSPIGATTTLSPGSGPAACIPGPHPAAHLPG